MKKIGIIFAMNKELELFASAVSDFTKEKGKNHTFYHGILENCELFAAVSGSVAVGSVYVHNVFSFSIMDIMFSAS